MKDTTSSRRGQAFSNAAAITPSDSTILPNCRAIYVGGAGNLSVMLDDDSAAVTITAPPVGTVLPLSAKKVMAATTATNLVALW